MRRDNDWVAIDPKHLVGERAFDPDGNYYPDHVQAARLVARC